MKKLFALLLSLILIVSLCACGNTKQTTTNNAANKANSANEVKATVINKDGGTESLSAKELADIKESNPLNFDNKYWCAKVTVTGKITDIGGLSNINGTNYKWTLTIEGGEWDWFIGDSEYNTSTVTQDFIATLSKGDTVQISGEIVGASFKQCDISNGTISVIKK